MAFNRPDPIPDAIGQPAAPGVVDFRVRVPIGLYSAGTPAPGSVDRYEEVFGSQSRIDEAPALDDLLTQMDTSGVQHAVMHAEYEAGDPVDELNRAVADAVRRHPARLSGIGTVSLDPFRIRRALRQVDACIEMEMVGLSLQPAFFDLDITDRRLYPIYAKAEEAELLVALHTGINYSSNRPMHREHPLQIDQICCDFNDLTVVASHAGWPWVADMVAVARRHTNVFLEFGGLAPKYVGETGGGWEVMYRFMNSLLAGQVLFGTDWPMIHHQRAIGEWREAGLKPEVSAALLRGNALKLLAKRRPASDGVDEALGDAPGGPGQQ